MLRKGMFISDRYEIIDKVGSGGMSDVYKAKCHKLNRFVAIKVLKQEFSQDTNFVSKFKVEAQNAAGLSHPNIVNVYDVGEDNGLHYIVMELIEGITLKKYIEKKGQLPFKEAVSIAIQVAQGIEAAHNKNIVHRDIKPQNIIISREGKVKVTDFGIARAASANTINSNAMGSVHYISPEQARGEFIDEKSDIYSLGITLYEMLTGCVPFEGDSTVTIAIQHIQEEMPSAKLYVPDLPISVEKIIQKCTQKKPERRYLKVSSLIADFKRSLVTPDEDFVQLVSTQTLTNDPTVVISGDVITTIRNKTGIDVDTDKKVEVMGGYDKTDVDLDEEIEPQDDLLTENPKLDKMMAIGGIVTGVIILMIAVYLALSFFGNGCSGGGGSIDEKVTTEEPKETDELDEKHTKIPELVGLTEEEAKDAIKNATLGYRLTRENSDDVEEGLVISFSLPSGEGVDEGEVVAKNTTILLVISDGPKTFKMPDLTGKTKEEAIQELTDLKLKAVSEYVDDEEYDLDVVVKTDPEYEDDVKAGDSITLYVSRGEEEVEEAVVPNLEGKTKSQAKKALEEEGLELGNVEMAYSDTVAKGLVIKQDTKAKSKLPIGATVDIVVSKGPKPTETTTEEKTTKETTTEEKTTKEEETTEPPTTAKKYNASVNLKKSDIEAKLVKDETTGAYAGAGTVLIKINGAWYNDFEYGNINEWPDQWTLNLPESETAGKVNVEIYVDDPNKAVFTVVVQYK
ncbi:MAG: Stk1 family PASTA domain-containing Ser/Thr kinase [Lachnospiraceae bacterium]|nr:Stk1 family PASTA domain-containing Ser/Thr kinase [Lachnospiraceae bacterium]